MDSRTKNTSRNIFFAILTQVVKILLTFVTRTFFIRYIGIEFLGLSSLFANILTLLSLAELGIGQAVLYCMYKPVADGDTEKIKSLLTLYRRLYFAVGTVIFVAGLVMMPFLDSLIMGEPPVGINIRVVFVIFLTQNAVGYFFAFRRVLLFAHQRGDIMSKVQGIVAILLNIIQIIIVLTTHNYYLFVILLPVTAGIDSVIVLIISYKMFPKIRGKSQKLANEEKKLIAKNTGALFFHAIGGIVIFGTSSIIVSFFLGLEILGVYSNYILLTTTIMTMLGLVCNALRGSVGNLIASTDKDYVLRIYNKLTFFLFVLVGFCSICLLILFQPFIRVWLGENYLLSFWIVVLMCINFYLTGCRQLNFVFMQCAGIFRQDLFKPIIEVVVMIPLSIILTINIGLAGVVIGVIVSTILAPMWIEPWMLFRHLFKRSSILYFRNYIIYTILTIAIGGIVFFIVRMMPYGNWGLFAIQVAVCVIVAGGLYLLIYFKTPHFRYFWQLITRVVRRRLSKQGVAPDAGVDKEVLPKDTKQ